MTPDAFKRWLADMKSAGLAKSDADCARLLGYEPKHLPRQKAKRETDASRAAIRDALKQFLTPGCIWDWKTDPRAGCVLRIRDKDNRRGCFI